MATKKNPIPSPAALHSWLAVVRAYNLCDAVMNERLAGVGLRLAEHEVLANLLRSPGLTQQQLAQRCFVAKSGVSMLVTRMEAQGLVRREADAGDARAKRLGLTPQGQALAEKARRIQDEVLLAMVTGASENELAVVTAAMERACGALEQLREGR